LPYLGYYSYRGVSSLEDIVNFRSFATRRNQRERVSNELRFRTSSLDYDFGSEESKKSFSIYRRKYLKM